MRPSHVQLWKTEAAGMEDGVFGWSVARSLAPRIWIWIWIWWFLETRDVCSARYSRQARNSVIRGSYIDASREREADNSSQKRAYDCCLWYGFCMYEKREQEDVDIWRSLIIQHSISSSPKSELKLADSPIPRSPRSSPRPAVNLQPPPSCPQRGPTRGYQRVLNIHVHKMMARQ